MTARQDADDLAWDRKDELWEEALRETTLKTTCCKMESFAEKLYGRHATFVPAVIVGGFNVLYSFRIDGVDGLASSNVFVRIPCLYQAVFPEEKTMAEAATVAFISQQTQLPVPRLLHHGVDPDIGPFMVIEDLETRRQLCTALETPGREDNEVPVLWPDIPETKLKSLYFQMARCTLQLARPTFQRIGALVETSPGSYDVLGRPITFNMNNMVTLSNIPKSVFPAEGTTFPTADEWYVVLAELQMATLLFQHNDIIVSEDDCRTKYVARQLFRRLAKQGRLATFGFLEDDWSSYSKQARGAGSLLPAPDGSGSFRLWSDDFRPVNVLVDEDDRVLGAIDWEFTYVAPAHFILDSPWWLLLKKPEMWDDGMDAWASLYERRLDTWVSAVEEAEQEDTGSSDSLLFSAYMRESWATGRFWLNYAARDSWAFDAIYWKYLDEKFFGEREGEAPTEKLWIGDAPREELWKTRVHLLSEEERAAMEPFVQAKMEERKERILVEWDAEEAKQRLSSYLFD